MTTRQTPPPFNDYTQQGERTTITGCRSTILADTALLYNLRHRWPRDLAPYSDPTIINAYDEFSLSDYHGNNGERFLDFMHDFYED